MEAYGGHQASLETAYTFVLPCFPEYVEDIAVYSGCGGVVSLELALELETGLHCLGDVGWVVSGGGGRAAGRAY